MKNIIISVDELEAHIVHLCERYNVVMEHANECLANALGANTESEAHGYYKNAKALENRADHIMARIEGIENALSCLSCQNIWITPNFNNPTPYISTKCNGPFEPLQHALISYVTFSYNYTDFGEDGWHVKRILDDNKNEE